jgi:DNA polymerase-3 subunit gamma/tau
LISSFEELLKICGEKKEMKLKYELEKNVNLVSFEKQRIEISFNDNLDKNFVKDLSIKLFEWTSQRWIITFSKTKGQISVKDRQINKKTELINLIKKSQIYNDVLEAFPDANLIDVISDKKKDDE